MGLLSFGAGILCGRFTFNKEHQLPAYFSTDTKTSSSEANDFSILVFGKVGAGNGGKWHSAPELADTIILVQFRPKTGSLNLISVPRDLFGTFGDEKFKINEVIRKDKIGELMEIMPEITGLTASHYAIFDLGIVKNIINSLGGVDVELSSSITDSVSGYRLKAGPHHLSGDDVAWIVRNRFASEGDFFREKNQHLIISAAMEKYRLLSGAEKIRFLIKAASELSSLQTDISPSDIVSLLRSSKEARMNSVVLDFKTGLLQSSSVLLGTSSAYVLIPKEGVDKYEAIKSFVQSKLIN